MSKQHPEDFREHLDSSDVGRPESPSDWLRDQGSAQTAGGGEGSGDRAEQPTSRATRRLAEHRISLPGPRTTVYSEEHGGSVQVDPWFAPDGMLRGGILILPDGAEIRAGPDVIEQMLGPDELHEARRRLGLVRGDTSDTSDDDLASSEMETSLPPVPLHAQIDSQGLPLMPDSTPTYFGRQPRPTEPPSGNWGYDEAFDDEHGLVSGTLLRNARKASRRAWPLVLLGAGWLWDRAQPLAQRMAAQWPNLHTGSTTRRTRIRRRAWMGALAAALVCLALSFCGTLSLIQRGNQLGVSNLPANPVDANATIADAASATATASAIIASGGIPPTPLPTQPQPTPTSTPSGGFCIIFCGPAPTPTPTNTPGPTPTPTPNPFAPSASVSFTPSSYTANAPSTLVTYDNAMDDAPGGTTRGQKLSSGSTTNAGGSWGNIWTQTAGPTSSIIEVEYSCNNSLHELCTALAGTRLSDQSGNGNDCHTLADVTTDTTTVQLVQCQLYNTGPITNSQVYYFGNSAPCGVTCSASWLKAQYTDVLGSNAQYAYFTPNPCSGDSGAAARSNVSGTLVSALGSGMGADAIGPQIGFSNTGSCANPSNCAGWSGGQNVGGASTYTICASGSAWKLTYSPSGAQNVQKARIVPNAGYAVDSSTIAVCGAVVVQSTDVPNQRATLSCPASATARYVWTSDMLTTLRGQLAGKTPSQANSMLAATAGIAANSIHVTIPSGFKSLPSDPNAITITVG